MDTQRNERSEALQSQILQFLTTEHFALQTGRSITVADASGRSSLFLSDAQRSSYGPLSGHGGTRTYTTP